ncbi:unnamed protein product, partial [Rotaria sp. Silwood1]
MFSGPSTIKINLMAGTDLGSVAITKM